MFHPVIDLDFGDCGVLVDQMQSTVEYWRVSPDGNVQ